jgi:hypothetical protein
VDPAPHPLSELTSLLRSLVQLYPQLFYKPLFGLAGASKDSTIVGQLGVVTSLARHMPEFWIRDPEMVSVALMSDIGGAIGKGKTKEGQPIPWGKTRLGQSLIILELVHCVKALTKDKKDPSSVGESLVSLERLLIQSSASGWLAKPGLSLCHWSRSSVGYLNRRQGAVIIFSGSAVQFLTFYLFTGKERVGPILPAGLAERLIIGDEAV